MSATHSLTMNSYPAKLTMCCALLVGVALWGGMAVKFASEDKLSYEPNVACLKGSPYGKIFALAMQGPIGFYWHEGKTHEHASILADDHEHHAGCADGCHEHQAAATGAELREGNVPLRVRTQEKIKQMEAAVHRKTNGEPLSAAHKQFIQGEIEDKLRLAYELDPTNYTNYGNYHLFLYTTSYGEAEADEDAALDIARQTLETCKKDEFDPASWLTAANAAYNIIYHIGRHHKDYSVAHAKASLAEFDYCIERHQELLGQALRDGRAIPAPRLTEMKERVAYLKKLRKAQGGYMKRVMSTKMAIHSPHHAN